MRRPHTTRFPPSGYILTIAPSFKPINRWSFVKRPAVYTYDSPLRAVYFYMQGNHKNKQRKKVNRRDNESR